MIKPVYILIMFLFSLAPLRSSAGNTPTEAVTVKYLRIVPVENRIKVSFTVTIDKKAVQSNYTLTLTPALVNGTNRAELRPLAVQGRRARIAAERQGMLPTNNSFTLSPLYYQKGKEVFYLSETAYEPWMEGAQLLIERFQEGCCNTYDLPAELLADQISVHPPAPPVPESTETPLPPANVQSTGDKLADIHAFLYNVESPEEKPERQNPAVVYYAVGQSSPINPHYMSNEATLNDLTHAVNAISVSQDCRIERIEIVGYASPEGSLERNTQLAIQRALSLKHYLIVHSTAQESAFELRNGSENWEELRKMVAASEMPEKERVLYIIDHTPVWDANTQTGRLGQLMHLNLGNTYRYIARNFFPKLRNAACVKVYYRNL